MSLPLSDYDYFLPEARIAQHPAERREDSRLAVLWPQGPVEHRSFPDFVDYISEGDCLVLNDTRVIPARLFGKKATGGKAEIFLLERQNENEWIIMGRPGRYLRAGEIFSFDRGITGEILEWMGEEGKRRMRFSVTGADLFNIGRIPLPPYINREAENRDTERYQTVYAEKDGAVAAPTAGLHFTNAILQRIMKKGVRVIRVTLHVGLGTFRPVSCDDMTQHRMEPEWCEVSQEACDAVNATRAAGKRVFAAGTTSAKALETAARAGLPLKPFRGRSDLYIHTPFEFRAVDALLTNFHMPKSTLLLLVSAFAGRDRILSLYREALEGEYRFLSYGDATLLLRG
ncbi:MAG: tRNA preQ1(34) S-adenosylmethionine ribosyltransferase-isomerase QueA [Fibrobacterota bacterium]